MAKSRAINNEKIYRLVDANLNRCREGLRVLEDTARFLWSDKALFGNFRKERHDLDRATRSLYAQLIDSRNSSEDAGRVMVETSSRNLKSVVVANFKRCEESLRVLEEYGKIFSTQSARRFKQARFNMYILEKKIAKEKFSQN